MLDESMDESMDGFMDEQMGEHMNGFFVSSLSVSYRLFTGSWVVF